MNIRVVAPVVQGCVQENELTFECEGQAGEIVEMPVRTVSPFRSCRLDVYADDLSATCVLNIYVEGKSMFPSSEGGVSSACFAPDAKNNLLNLASSKEGGEIRIAVAFLESGKWKGVLRRNTAELRHACVDAESLLARLG